MSEDEGDTEGTSMPHIGEVIEGRYKILELLGEGGMGAVYVAEHLTLHKEVALKLIHASYAGDGDMRARFAREALASAKLDHPHVASAIDFGSLPDGSAYLVIQLVRGPSLDTAMGDGPIPWERAAILGAQIADALAAAHGLGIVHRDLKPDNVLLARRDDGSELVKVLDFGIARVPTDAEKAPQGADTHRPLTKVGTVMGTPGYMAPEQALGDTVDHRADLYSLGVILWEMIAGRYLFEGELSSIVVKQLSESAPALGSVVDDPSIPEELELLVEELLGKAASERPSDAASVRDRLQQLVFRASVGNDISGLSALPYVARPTPTTGTRRISQITGMTPVVGPTPSSNGKLWVGIGVGIAVAAVAVFAALELTETDLLGAASGDGSEAVTATLLPPAVQGAIDTLVLSGDASARTAAADSILSYLPVSDLPPYALALAQLEKAEGCRPRRLALKKVQEIRDPAALPYLKRLRALPRRGCGPRNNRDCYACIRGDILDAYNALTAAEEAQAAAP